MPEIGNPHHAHIQHFNVGPEESNITGIQTQDVKAAFLSVSLAINFAISSPAKRAQSPTLKFYASD
jgi:hypothetical protein